MSFTSNLKPGSKFTMPPSGRILMPFVVEAYVASLPVFCANAGVVAMLDPLIEFLEDGNFQFINRACPSTQQEGGSNVVLAKQSFEDQISVATGSFLIMVAGISFKQTDPSLITNPFNVLSNNFRTLWYDSGAQASLFGGFVHANNITGRFTPTPPTGTGMRTTVSRDKNLFILPSPLTITSPGQLNVQVTNLEDVAVTIDMAFYFATPTGSYASVTGSVVGNAVNR